MNYEDALRHWGATKLAATLEHQRAYERRTAKRSRKRLPILDVITIGAEDPQLGLIERVDVETVVVEFSFDEGFPCCGGRDPSCYCSFASSPKAEVRIDGQTDTGRHLSATIHASDFDFATVLGEIVAAGGGTVSAPTAT